MKNIYIFGVHSRAQTLGFYLTYLNPDIKIEAYIYNNDEPNPDNVSSIPVMNINNKSQELHTEYPVYIGTRGVYHDSIISELKSLNFADIIPVTVALDLELRNKYLKKYFASVDRDFVKFEELEKTEITSTLSHKIYVAKSIYDKELNSGYRLADYEQEIQVGAALTEQRLALDVITDNTGDNISKKNRQFCELTALYWIWKNVDKDVIGLCHYRRHFILPDNWINIMDENNIDVLLPIPLYVTPSVKENFKKRHDKFIWDTMIDILSEKYKEYVKASEKYFNGNLYSPCNMFIMKKEILNEFNKWLFPMLFELEERIGQIDDIYLNRYPGFVSERLLSMYFEANKDKYKIAYADKNFLM